MGGFDKFDIIIKALGHEGALDALLRALSEQEKQDNADYISRMYEISFEEEEEQN